MCPKLSIRTVISDKQRGSALVLALFIIVVTTLLGAALVRMISANSETIVYEVIGTRAYQAAQAGAQRKLSEVFPLLPGSVQCTQNTLYNEFSTVQGLENCVAIDVDCVEGPTVDDIVYYTITSTGQCNVAEVFTSRTIEIKARRLE
ncbi:PilX N-terminal domain-containing pilus assembly protein [Colwellia psychrerythraea]|uniref:Type 4 fimbrial biogenesis protein PilX, N-terminal domain containing protein n=1 Tax=Colwellia psychrerythraea TaxID=28229 RepID=A0A099KVT4_COLPS|nr:PilX N-terminal domain-containing pilus assembly protein [Colwellia psychrerythraea]KGJ94300.1 Type 4 fimbrial biogenesis protein PilX, N-terminal domain containing protein [Colwellia psychrerythraea]